MIDRLSALATAHSRRVLIVSALVFVLAATLGTPVLSSLKSASSDFQDPSAQNQQLLRAVEHATGQQAEYGVAALVPTGGVVRPGAPGSLRLAGGAGRVATLLARERGFQRVLDYPASGLPQLVSRDGLCAECLAIR